MSIPWPQQKQATSFAHPTRSLSALIARVECPCISRILTLFQRALHHPVARHKSLDVFPPSRTGTKSVGLSLSEVTAIIKQDFEKRQYYVTGRLTKQIYADDCYFDAPDPDMPVGLAQTCIPCSFIAPRKTMSLMGWFNGQVHNHILTCSG